MELKSVCHQKPARRRSGGRMVKAGTSSTKTQGQEQPVTWGSFLTVYYLGSLILLLGVILCIVGRSAASLASTH